jgi:hypothetical protein
MKTYRAKIVIQLSLGQPTPTIELQEDPTGDLVKLSDIPYVTDDVSARLARLDALEAEHAKLVATLQGAT